MKKVIALVLAVLMAVTLFACQTNIEPQASPAASTSPSASTAAPASASVAAPASASPAASPAASGTANSITSKSMVDFQYDFKNASARETCKIAYIMPVNTPYNSAMNDCYKALGEKLNYTFSFFEAGNDNEKFMNLITTAGGQDYDGLIIEGDTTTYERILDIMKEYPNTAIIPGLSPWDDTNGNYQWPSVVVASYDRGGAAMKYALDNYKKYTNSDIDIKDIGFITINFSVVTDFIKRVSGAVGEYKKSNDALMNTNYFELDSSAETNPFSADAAFNLVTPIIASNRQFKGWIIYGCIEDFGDGASRALETAGLDKTSVVVSDSAAMLIRKWQTGYQGCWIAGADTPQMQWADGTVSGLLSLIDGAKTKETLWESMRTQGQKYTVINLPYTVVDKDNVKDYLDFQDNYLANKYGK